MKKSRCRTIAQLLTRAPAVARLVFVVGVIGVIGAIGVAGCAGAPAHKTSQTTSAAEAPVLEPFSWTEPSCFAYAADTDGYACLDFALSSDATGVEELTPMDFTRWQPIPATAWSGHKAIELVAGENMTLGIADKAYDVDSPIVYPQTEVAARRQASDKGYDANVEIERKALDNGEWIEIHGASLRFRSRLHTGDASEYYVGSLQLVCGGQVLSTAVELLADGRGESAVAFAAAGARSIVVSLIESGGGEGSWYFRTKNLRVDLAERCGT